MFANFSFDGLTKKKTFATVTRSEHYYNQSILVTQTFHRLADNIPFYMPDSGGAGVTNSRQSPSSPTAGGCA